VELLLQAHLIYKLLVVLAVVLAMDLLVAVVLEVI
jgi:hypothetical protein